MVIVGIATVAMLTPAGSADAATNSVGPWDLEPTPYIYGPTPGGGSPVRFYNNDRNSPRFRWSSNTAHSTGVRVVLCNGAAVGPYMDIPAHSTAYRTFNVFLNRPTCFHLRGYSKLGVQSRLFGYLLA